MVKKKIIALAITALLLTGAFIYLIAGNQSDEHDNDTQGTSAYDGISVYYIVNGTSDKRAVDGSTLKEMFDNAVNDIKFNSAGQVSSVAGIKAGTGQKWVMWIWSYGAWSSISSVMDDVELHNGTDLALSLSDMVVNNGVYSYAEPGFNISHKVWFYVKFAEDSNANSYVASYLTQKQRETGFWVCGEGIDASHALMDVSDELGWNLSMDMKMTPTGWLNSFFGLSDKYNVTSGNWTYWSQYHWDGQKWVFNQSVLGGYDITEVCYFALVRQTTEEKGVSFSWDVTPDDIPESLLA